MAHKKLIFSLAEKRFLLYLLDLLYVSLDFSKSFPQDIIFPLEDDDFNDIVVLREKLSHYFYE